MKKSPYLSEVWTFFIIYVNYKKAPKFGLLRIIPHIEAFILNIKLLFAYDNIIKPYLAHRGKPQIAYLAAASICGNRMV